MAWLETNSTSCPTISKPPGSHRTPPGHPTSYRGLPANPTAATLAQAQDLEPSLMIEAHIERELNPHIAARNVIVNHRRTGNSARTIQNLQNVCQDCTEQAIDDVLDELETSPAEREEAPRLFAEAFGGGQEALATYRVHQEQMIVQCRAMDATMVLATHPFHSALDSSMQDVAKRSETGMVALAYEFDRKLRGQERSDYFVGDGHCNDAGCSMMASIVAQDGLERIEAK